MFDGVMKLWINGTKTGRVLHPSPVILAGKTARPGLLKAFVFIRAVVHHSSVGTVVVMKKKKSF